MGAAKHTLPPCLEGHWTSPDGHEMAERYARKSRAELAMSDRADFGLANAIYLISRDSLDLVALQTAAKERLRWLSVQLAVVQAERDELLGACREMIRLADMGLEESLREPEENGNFTAYERARAVIAKASPNLRRDET